MSNTPSRRLVKVLIADPDPQVPLDKALLYRGDEKFTDATDQELFFEIDLKGILESHNTYRITIPQKGTKDPKEYLEPARIRDLKMIVITIATL